MKRHILCPLFVLILALSACMNNKSSSTLMPTEHQIWQDAYAKLLKNSNSDEFYLFDIDGDGFPEILVGGLEAGGSKYASYDIYAYIDSNPLHLGAVHTTINDIWADGNGSILVYDYGAGSGEMLRYYIENNEICYDDQIYWYYYENGEQVEWFKNSYGEETRVTEDTKQEYQHLRNSIVLLEKYTNAEYDITNVIYGWQ